MTPEERLRDFVSLVESGRSLDAIDRYYADDVIVFENHERARIGKTVALDFERKALAESPSPTTKAHGAAIDPRSGRSFVEWTIRFTGRDGRPMRLDEVAVQTWASGRIVEERFYYEGIIDEGDPEPESEPLPG